MLNDLHLIVKIKFKDKFVLIKINIIDVILIAKNLLLLMYYLRYFKVCKTSFVT